MIMSKPILVSLLLLLSVTALADDTAMLKQQNQGSVTFVSGGVGSDEWDTLQATKGEYNLRLLFTVQGTGEYLSNVKVTIADAKGNVFLDTVAEGPLFFARLEPGRYTVNADLDGKSFRKRAVIAGTKPVSLTFVWPQ